MKPGRYVIWSLTQTTIGEEGERILRGWISQRPDAAYFKMGLNDVLRLAYAPDEWEFDVDSFRTFARWRAKNDDVIQTLSPYDELLLRPRQIPQQPDDRWCESRAIAGTKPRSEFLRGKMDSERMVRAFVTRDPAR